MQRLKQNLMKQKTLINYSQMMHPKPLFLKLQFRQLNQLNQLQFRSFSQKRLLSILLKRLSHNQLKKMAHFLSKLNLMLSKLTALPSLLQNLSLSLAQELRSSLKLPLVLTKI